MKQLSIEEKAKAYDDLLVKLQEAKVDNNVCDERYCCVIDDIVPELKESEDEKIRKEIYNALKYLERELSWDALGEVDILDAYAWLEKQGEQKPWSEEDESKRKLIEDELSGLIADERDIESPLTKRAKDLYSALYWLKSLRPQSHWKPSNEQMEALEHFIVYHNGSTNYAKDLEELRLQLKKLRE